ncbi:MAG: hypothetical protein KDD82_21720 [Planctomycetes bacterium]|nr:hypothetical protein [Planctomycetota bacterium]
MYCWGDDMSNWAKADAYAFKGGRAAKSQRDAAAKAAVSRGGRKYERRKAPSQIVLPKGRTITTQSTTPVVVAVDVTGSMASWPAEIFDRLPLLYQTLSQYRPDLEVSFVAIGDATCDRFPLQVCDFEQGVALEDQLKALYPEGGGGGQTRESYELFAYYLLHCYRAPNAERPFLILYGDEGFYDRVDRAQVKHFVGDEIPRALSSKRVWSQVVESWNLYHLRKPYGGAQDAEIEAQWADAIGEERIVGLDDEMRAVDMALGLIARSWGEYADFETNMLARQDEGKVAMLRDKLDAVRGSW